MIPIVHGNREDRHYWLYEKVKVGPLTLLKHTGEKVSLTKDDPAPQNCSWWECPKPEEGRAYYLDADTGIWHEGPDKVSVEDVKTAFVKKAQSEFDAEVKKIENTYSKYEEMSWDYQLAEAKRVLSGESSDFINILSEDSGESPEEIAKKIKNKSDERMLIYAKALAKLRKARKEAESTTLTALKGMSLHEFLSLGL